jgi:hypothetical protein
MERIARRKPPKVAKRLAQKIVEKSSQARYKKNFMNKIIICIFALMLCAELRRQRPKIFIEVIIN